MLRMLWITSSFNRFGVLNLSVSNSDICAEISGREVSNDIRIFMHSGDRHGFPYHVSRVR